MRHWSAGIGITNRIDDMKIKRGGVFPLFLPSFLVVQPIGAKEPPGLCSRHVKGWLFEFVVIARALADWFVELPLAAAG
jgi:hypothetical protein